MKDDRIERVLDGLGKIEAPVGLEGKVLRRLAERKEERSSAWAWGFSLTAGMVLVGVCILQFGGSERRGAEHTPGAKAALVSRAERPKAEALGYLQATATSRATKNLQDALERGGAERTPGATAPSLGRAAERPKALGYLQAAARPKALESFPAPPEPLTEQERLLVRVARHPRAGEVEFLIAEVREAELIKSNAEFDLFFPASQASESTEVTQPVEEKEKSNEVQPKVR